MFHLTCHACGVTMIQTRDDVRIVIAVQCQNNAAKQSVDKRRIFLRRFELEG